MRKKSEIRTKRLSLVAFGLRSSDLGFHSLLGARIADLIRHSSFIPQRLHRIDFRGAARRQVACDQGHPSQYECRSEVIFGNPHNFYRPVEIEAFAHWIFVREEVASHCLIDDGDPVHAAVKPRMRTSGFTSSATPGK